MIESDESEDAVELEPEALELLADLRSRAQGCASIEGEHPAVVAAETSGAREPSAPPEAPAAPVRALFQGVSIKRTGQKPKRVIAVSGGKGGAGKTVLAVNLGIYLSTLGRTTLVVDADRSGAHLHTLIGVPPLLPSQASYRPELPALDIQTTSVPGLFFLSGGVAEGNAGQARPRTRRELFDALPMVDCDYMVLDLGAGIEPELIDAFLSADVALYVTVPEPAAVEGTYRFVRALYLRRLLRMASDEAQARELSGLADELGGLPVPRELAEALEADEHPLADAARKALLTQPLHFVVNQARVRADSSSWATACAARPGSGSACCSITSATSTTTTPSGPVCASASRCWSRARAPRPARTSRSWRAG